MPTATAPSVSRSGSSGSEVLSSIRLHSKPNVSFFSSSRSGRNRPWNWYEPSCTLAPPGVSASVENTDVPPERSSGDVPSQGASTMEEPT